MEDSESCDCSGFLPEENVQVVAHEGRLWLGPVLALSGGDKARELRRLRQLEYSGQGHSEAKSAPTDSRLCRRFALSLQLHTDYTWRTGDHVSPVNKPAAGLEGI